MGWALNQFIQNDKHQRWNCWTGKMAMMIETFNDFFGSLPFCFFSVSFFFVKLHLNFVTNIFKILLPSNYVQIYIIEISTLFTVLGWQNRKTDNKWLACQLRCIIWENYRLRSKCNICSKGFTLILNEVYSALHKGTFIERRFLARGRGNLGRNNFSLT